MLHALLVGAALQLTHPATADERAWLEPLQIQSFITNTYRNYAAPRGTRIYFSANRVISDRGRVTEVPLFTSYTRTASSLRITTWPSFTHRVWTFSARAKFVGIDKVSVDFVLPGTTPDAALRKNLISGRGHYVRTIT